MRYELRDFQSDMVARCRREYAAGHQGVLLQSETGTGKTVMFCNIVESAAKKGKRSVLLVHTRELLKQTVEKLRANDVRYGVVAAGWHNPDPFAPAQVCMVHSVANRVLQWEPDLLIIDEAHLAVAPTYLSLATGRWPNARRLLVTATPRRLDRQGFETLATAMVCGPTYTEQVARGFLVPVRHFSTPWVDTDQLRVKGGEYDTESAVKAYRGAKLLGDVVAHWHKLSAGRPTITFGVNVEHSRLLAAEFAAAGVPTAHLSGETPGPEREQIIADLKAGRLLNVCNCAVLTAGFDAPNVSCVVVVRPTLSLTLFRQMGGRGTRPDDGKHNLHLHDHGRNVERHGLIDEPVEWTLDGVEPKPKDGMRMEPIRCCVSCWATVRVSDIVERGICPECGGKLADDPKPLEHAREAELVEVSETPTSAKRTRRKITDWRLWHEVDRQRQQLGHQPGWTWYEYWRQHDLRRAA